MVYKKSVAQWASEPCFTEVDEKALEVNCQCNPIDGEYIGIFTDTTRLIGAPIEQVKPSVIDQAAVVITNSGSASCIAVILI